MCYVGTIQIQDIIYQYRLSNFELYIFNYEAPFIKWKPIIEIIKDDWIVLRDNMGIDIYAKLDNARLTSAFEYKFDVLAIVVCASGACKDIDKGELKFNEMCIQSDILDCFFRHDKTYRREMLEILASEFQIEELPKFEKREEFRFVLDNVEYNCKFTTVSQGYEKESINGFRNALIISSSEIDDVEKAWKIMKTVKKFIQFISQSAAVTFANPVRMVQSGNYNDINIYMNVRPDENATIRKELVIEYDEIKDGLGKLFEMFYRDEICNRSLFICDSQKITYMDIMNICAAFEAQFRESYGNKYKIQKQEDVKNKLVKFIENHKTELINENEEEAYSDTMQGLKNVTETLQARIQQSLDELENDYGKERIKARFMVDYENMPCRIKNSRNAMDHGRKNYKLSYNEYLDSELLRAIVYMLALKKAGIVDKNKLISVIDKISYNR